MAFLGGVCVRVFVLFFCVARKIRHRVAAAAAAAGSDEWLGGVSGDMSLVTHCCVTLLRVPCWACWLHLLDVFCPNGVTNGIIESKLPLCLRV